MQYNIQMCGVEIVDFIRFRRMGIFWKITDF